ncbi:MAG: glycoside hydrolase family 71/99-like protein [Opitutales bacterium]
MPVSRLSGNALVAVLAVLFIFGGVGGGVVVLYFGGSSDSATESVKVVETPGEAGAIVAVEPVVNDTPEPDLAPASRARDDVLYAMGGPIPEYDDIENKILTLDDILQPYEGPIVVDQENETIYNKIMSGYQGWFGHPDDGYNFGERHWGRILDDPPRCTVDMWPDMSELDEDEKYLTNYKYEDGSPAHVFSSRNKKTVVRHFKWMREHNIHGVFKQRFGARFVNKKGEYYASADDLQVLSHVREGANRYGRLFAVMYDVSFNAATIDGMIEDWKNLYHKMKITETPAYMRHRGGPIVTFWGYADKFRPWDPVAAEKLFKFFKDPANGGCTIMVGVPDNNWAQWDDERMELLKKYVTIVSPWTPGRYRSPEGARAFFQERVPGDLAITKANDLDYYPVIFPGFSWANLKQEELNSIPRLGGKFLWTQGELVKEYGINMAYVAMFDEVDEGTAIFKVSNQPPVGRFATYEGYPSDHYLRLTGLIGEMIAGNPVSFPDVVPEPDTYVPLTALEYYQDTEFFSEDVTEQWREVFRRVPVICDSEDYGKWALSLNNVSSALNMYFRPWSDIVGIQPNKYVLVMAQQRDLYTTGDVPREQVNEFVKKCLQKGTVLLVMSDARNPLQQPRRGEDARKFGFRLSSQRASSDCTVEFQELLGGRIANWTWRNLSGKTPASRLMSASDYTDAEQYISLAKVNSASGEYLGDAAAIVTPGGDLGPGKIVYISSMMTSLPGSRKKQFLESVVTKISDLVK